MSPVFPARGMSVKTYRYNPMLDCHNHTNRSYCADECMTVDFYLEKLQDKDEPRKIAITDHGMAIYFKREDAWRWEFITDSRIFDQNRDRGNKIMAEYLDGIKKYPADKVVPGLEAEMMEDGRLTFDPAFRNELKVLIGSVHYLPVNAETANEQKIIRYWENHVSQLLNSDIDILGHPFRWLCKQIEVQDSLVSDLVRKAKNAGVAVEVNSHFHTPTDSHLLRNALEIGASVAFGTDSHYPEEPGDLSYHMRLLENLGIKLEDIKLFGI